jgi:hypothetical protein
MHLSGADRPVVVMKRGNARGAKGAGHSRWDWWANGKPEEPTDVGGRRQSSVSGTSRMNREIHVRSCERLGVKFPGPTRLRFDPASLAWYAWIAARLGGWMGYFSKRYRPPGPKIMARGLKKLDLMVEGWLLRNRSRLTAPR